MAQRKLEQDRTTLAGFSEQLRRHGMVAGARVLSAAERPARPGVAAALKIAAGDPVCEIRRVRLGDGSPPPPEAADEDLYYPACYRGANEIRRTTTEEDR